MKVKIIQKGWEGYNGTFGAAVFKDGVAEVPSRAEALRIGSLVRLVQVETDGTEGGAVSPAQEILNTKGLSAQVVESRRAEAVEDEQTETAEDEDSSDVKETRPTYSREQLEAIADEKGIAGIREIAAPLDVKGTSIAGLIGDILAASKSE